MENFPSNSINLKVDTEAGQVIKNNQIFFTIEVVSNSLHNRQILSDSNGNPIFTLYKKIMTIHDRWEVYKGKSTDPKDLFYSVKRTSMIQWGIIELKVFLASNRAENVCDFKVNAALLKRSCTISSVGSSSSTVMAKMKKNSGGNYDVTMHPNFINDLGFIVTLILILDTMSHIDDVSKNTFKVVRMTIDPFDFSGFVLEQFGEVLVETVLEPLVETIVEPIVEEILENNNTSAN